MSPEGRAAYAVFRQYLSSEWLDMYMAMNPDEQQQASTTILPAIGLLDTLCPPPAAVLPEEGHKKAAYNRNYLMRHVDLVNHLTPDGQALNVPVHVVRLIIATLQTGMGAAVRRTGYPQGVVHAVRRYVAQCVDIPYPQCKGSKFWGKHGHHVPTFNDRNEYIHIPLKLLKEYGVLD